MLIEKETKNLSESIEFNSLGENKKKRQIILAETKRNHRDYINSLRYRYNKKTLTYQITLLIKTVKFLKL